MGRSKRPFHRPFQQLRRPQCPGAPRESSETSDPTNAVDPEGASLSPGALDDQALFASEMAGVKRFSGRSEYVGERRTVSYPKTADAEAIGELQALVSGDAPFDPTGSDEHVEAVADGVDRRVLRALRKGQYSVSAHLDLHEMTRVQAKQALERFIGESRVNGRRCVLVVHGRGLNSEDGVPVLKEAVRAWLTRGRIARSVLAFCSALPCDGGPGAVYVLLRR